MFCSNADIVSAEIEAGTFDLYLTQMHCVTILSVLLAEYAFVLQNRVAK